MAETKTRAAPKPKADAPAPPAVETAHEVVDAESKSTAVATLEPLKKIAAGLATLKAEAQPFDLTTSTGEKSARVFRAKCVSLRTGIDDAYETVNRPLLAIQRDARALRDDIKAGVKTLEDPVDAQIKAEESRREVERIRKAEAEANRIAALNLRIDEIKAVAARAVGKPAAEVEAKIQLLTRMTICETFQELKPAAEQAHAATLATLRELHTAAVAQEAEAARIAEERAELNRQRAAQEAEDALIASIRENASRIEGEGSAYIQKAIDAFETGAKDWDADPAGPRVVEAIAAAREQMGYRLAVAKNREALDAERAAETQRVADQRAQLEKDQREARERQERADAQARAEREEADRKASAAREQADREARERREAEELRIANERAALRRDQEERDRKEREASEARGRAEREAREAEDRTWREAAEAEERRQAEARAEQRRLEELAAIADKCVRDAAHQLLAALRLLTGLVKGMSNDDQEQRPTDAELDAALAQADAAIDAVDVVDAEFTPQENACPTPQPQWSAERSTSGTPPPTAAPTSASTASGTPSSSSPRSRKPRKS